VRVYDALRCPYCARVRLVIAEKGLDVERVVVDLSDRPAWIIELNPPNGRVPVLDDGFVLPESQVIMDYLEERHPESALLPAALPARAEARLVVHRFDSLLGDDYYACRRGDENRLAERLDELPVGRSLYSDFAFAPWVIRARDMLGVTLPGRVASWLDELAERPSVAAEVEVVRSL
jgi:glutathione S-transferase